MPINIAQSGSDINAKGKKPFGTRATKFLKLLNPEGPWTITTIVPDGPTTTRTFNDAEEARRFITKQNRDRQQNAYFTINPTRYAVSKKPKKEEISWVNSLHVDADPNDEESPDQFKRRLRQKVDGFRPKPTFIVDSGNGIQLLWWLDKPVKITGPDVIADVEARNHALAEAFGADPSTRNIDRLFRLPSTFNYPNKRKRKIGRKKCRARLLSFNESNVYPLTAFPAKVQGERKPERPVSGANGELPPKLASLLSVKGNGAYKSRSQLAFAFITGAIRANVADEIIIKALLDPKYRGYGIYEHIADNGGRKYAKAQVKHAKEKMGSASAQTVKTYEVVRASAVVIQPLQWLWQGHLLRGAQELMTGIKGLGKSQVHASLVAHATTGRDWPDGAPGCEPGNVIMVTAEDSLEQVVVPRLMAAGADLDRIHFLKAIKQDDKRRWFLLGQDLDMLEQMIRDIDNVNLVTIDPLTAYMGKINSHNTTDVRGQLGPLADLAERTNVALSTITHPPKHGSGKAIDQFIGSQAFITAARISHLITPEIRLDALGNPIPTGRNLYTMGPTNHQRMPTLAYRIEEMIVQPSYARGDREAAIRSHAAMTDTVYVEWANQEVKITADEALAAGKYKPAATHAIDAFLRGILKQAPMAQRDVIASGEKQGFSEDQLKRARRRINAQTRKIGIDHWEWSLK